MGFHRACYEDFNHKKALKKFTAISVPTENDKGRASARGKGEKGMYNQIYSYLFIFKYKHDLHNNILVQKALYIIRKYIDLCSATSAYLCIL